MVGDGRLCVCQPQGGSTALICAAAEGHIECVRLLVESGANKDVKNKVRALGLLLFL
jgi:ankyrin repeat protein